MMTRMMLAALLALGAVPALAGDASNEAKVVVSSSDEARIAAAKRIEAQRIEAQQEAKGVQKLACACPKHAS